MNLVYYGSLERVLPPLVRHVVYGLRLLPSALRSDVILGFDTWSTGLPALLVARLLGKTFVVRIGGDVLWESYVERGGDEVLLSRFYDKKPSLTYKEKIIRWSNAYISTHANRLLFTTTWQCDIWKRAYLFNDTRVRIVENAYPMQEEGIIPEKRVFVAAGRNIRLKNMSRFKRVFNQVKERHPDIELDTRPLPHAEHLVRVRACYAVAVPSLSEVCPNLVIDAARYGKPFLCTQDTGIRDRLPGVYVDTLDEGALERGLEELLNPGQYRELSQASREAYRARSYEAVAGDIVSAISA